MIEVTDVINAIEHTLFQPSTSVCLLGLVEQLIPTVAERTMISLLFIYTWKAITMTWKQAPPPTLSFGKQLMKSSLPLYEDTYINRGCPKKYDKVWLKWLAEPSMASSPIAD